MALAPEIASFGDGDHTEGETGLTITGGGFGAFPGTAWIYQNADRSGFSDQLTVGTWNDIELTGVEIPATPNNSTGSVYLFVEHENLAWSQGFEFTLSAAGGNPPVLLSSIPNLAAGFDSGTHQYELGDYFSGATSYAIDPTVEVGWTFNTTTGQLEIDTDDEATFGPYTVTATNATGDTDSNAFTVRVSAWDALAYFGGTAYSDLGVMGSTFLDDSTAVPAGAFIRQGFAHDADGRRYVALWPADDAVTYQAGIARRADGAMIIATSGTTVSRIQGLALTYRGEVIAAVDTPAYRHNGWPCLADGTLCISEVS